MDDFLGGIFGALIIGDLLKSRSGVMFLVFVTAITIPLAAAYHFYTKPVSQTKGIIAERSKMLCASGPESSVVVLDYWDIPTVAEVTRDGNGSLFCVVTSAGRDNVFGTRDDLVANEQNINKSRIAGSWLKDKGIEAIKGVFLGDNREVEK